MYFILVIVIANSVIHVVLKLLILRRVVLTVIVEAMAVEGLVKVKYVVTEILRDNMRW